MKALVPFPKRVTVEYRDGGINLHGLSTEAAKKVMDELTFPNPLYAATKKYSKWNNTRVEPYLMYYEEDRTTGDLFVPSGFDYSRFPRIKVLDGRVLRPATFPPFTLTLREDQKDAYDKFFQCNSTPALAGSIQLPTGKGKTILALAIARALGQRTLVVVHKDDLVEGWQKDIKLAFNGKVTPGLIKAKSFVLGEQITIATVQTLTRIPRSKMIDLLDTFGFVVQDEMHHCPASSFEIVSRFTARYRLGITATPERSDGLEHVMSLYFGSFCSVYEYVQEDQDILPVQVTIKEMPDSITPVCMRTKKGSWVLTDPTNWGISVPLPESAKPITEIPYKARPRVPFAVLDNVAVSCIRSSVCADILHHYKQGHSCVAFFTQKEHCRMYKDHLERMGVLSCDIGLYYGDNNENSKVLKQAESKRKFVTLTTYAKATEGTNVTRWEVAFFVSSMNNERNVEQAAGRIRRIRKDGDKLKTAIIYDYRMTRAYSLRNHGASRDNRYSKLKFIMPKVPVFQKGYRRT